VTQPLAKRVRLSENEIEDDVVIDAVNVNPQLFTFPEPAATVGFAENTEFFETAMLTPAPNDDLADMGKALDENNDLLDNVMDLCMMLDWQDISPNQVAVQQEQTSQSNNFALEQHVSSRYYPL